MTRTVRFALSPAIDAAPRWLGMSLAVIGGAALIALASRVQVPMWPVPATLQTLAVLALAIGLGRKVAVGAVLAWLAYGAIGVPVFASGGGLAYLTGPTAGYMAGFLLAAHVVGGMATGGSRCRVLPVFGLGVLGGALIYLPGVLWLAGFVGLEQALRAGLLPFVPGDLIKAAVLACVLPPLHRRVGRQM